MLDKKRFGLVSSVSALPKDHSMARDVKITYAPMPRPSSQIFSFSLSADPRPQGSPRTGVLLLIRERAKV